MRRARRGFVEKMSSCSTISDYYRWTGHVDQMCLVTYRGKIVQRFHKRTHVGRLERRGEGFEYPVDHALQREQAQAQAKGYSRISKSTAETELEQLTIAFTLRRGEQTEQEFPSLSIRIGQRTSRALLQH